MELSQPHQNKPALTKAIRYHLTCDSSDIQHYLDRICAKLSRAKLPYGFLSPGENSLLANISVAENLWLPAAWRQRIPAALLGQRLQGLIQCLPVDHRPDLATLTALMSARPGQLVLRQRWLIVLLRAALVEPVWVVLDPDWLQPNVDPGPCMPASAMEALLGRASWIIPAGREQVLAGPWSWVRIEHFEPLSAPA